MSTPARRMPHPAPRAGTNGAGVAAPARVPVRRSAPNETPARRPAERPRVQPSPRPAASRRKQHHLGFVVLAGALVGAMVFGIVVLHVLLAQQSFRIDAAEQRVEALGAQHLDLVRAQATLSAPGRIAGWATRHGMRLPDDIRILRAPNGSPDRAGADISSAADDPATTGGG